MGKERNAPHLTGPAAPAGTPKEAPRHNRRGERRERRRGQEGGDGDLRRDVRGRGALAAGPAGEDGGGAGGGVTHIAARKQHTRTSVTSARSRRRVSGTAAGARRGGGGGCAAPVSAMGGEGGRERETLDSEKLSAEGKERVREWTSFGRVEELTRGRHGGLRGFN